MIWPDSVTLHFGSVGPAVLHCSLIVPQMCSLEMLKLDYSVQRTCTVSNTTTSSASKCSVIWHADVFVMRKYVTAKHAIADYAMHVSEYVCTIYLQWFCLLQVHTHTKGGCSASLELYMASMTIVSVCAWITASPTLPVCPWHMHDKCVHCSRCKQ